MSGQDQQYTPSEARVRLDYQDCYPRLPAETTRAEFDRFIAQVRRDAAAKALYEVATDLDNYDDYLTVWNRANQIEETR